MQVANTLLGLKNIGTNRKQDITTCICRTQPEAICLWILSLNVEELSRTSSLTFHLVKGGWVANTLTDFRTKNRKQILLLLWAQCHQMGRVATPKALKHYPWLSVLVVHTLCSTFYMFVWPFLLILSDISLSFVGIVQPSFTDSFSSSLVRGVASAGLNSLVSHPNTIYLPP